MEKKAGSEGRETCLEHAAKYVCNKMDGRCPAVLEGFDCGSDCGIDVVPWRCWISYFRAISVKRGGDGEGAWDDSAPP